MSILSQIEAKAYNPAMAFENHAKRKAALIGKPHMAGMVAKRKLEAGLPRWDACDANRKEAEPEPRIKPWSPGEDKTLRRMRDQGFTAKEIAARLGRTLYSIEKRARAIGLHRPARIPNAEVVAAENEQIKDLFERGFSYTVIAGRIGKSCSTVTKRARKMGLVQVRIPKPVEPVESYQERREKAAMPLASIKREVAQKYDIAKGVIESQSRQRLHTQARQEFYWRARRETSASTTQIAKASQRDHTTVIHGVNAYERLQRVKAGLEPKSPQDNAVSWPLVIDLEADE